MRMVLRSIQWGGIVSVREESRGVGLGLLQSGLEEDRNLGSGYRTASTGHIASGGEDGRRARSPRTAAGHIALLQVADAREEAQILSVQMPEKKKKTADFIWFCRKKRSRF